MLNDTRNAPHHGCHRTMFLIEKHLQQRGIEIIARCFNEEDWQQNPSFKEKIRHADILIINGEGTVHHGSRRGETLLKAGSWAKENSTPAVLINSTYQLNPEGYKEHLNNLSLISVRETLSKWELQKVGVDAEVVPDITFSTPLKCSGNRNGVGVTDSVIHALTYELVRLCHLNNFEYLPITFTGNNVNRKRAYIAEIQEGGIFRVAVRKMRNALLSHFAGRKIKHSKHYLTTSHEDYIHRICLTSMVVTGRYHSLCFAIQTGTPFVCLRSNSHKINALIDDVGLNSKRIVEPRQLSSLDLKQYAYFSREERVNIDRFNNQAIKSIESLFDRIKIIADSRQ